jgi:hypothetical protein
MTPWMMVLFIIVTPNQPAHWVIGSAMTENGCQARAAEFIKTMEPQPALAQVKCIYMPPMWGST